MSNNQTPEEFESLKHKSDSVKVAVGIPSVVSGVKHIFGQMPVLRGLKTISRLNQKGGVDCPSCAWADPEGHRSRMAEYCENGLKAIADEATTTKADPEFFRKYSVKELTGQSDFWLGQHGRITHPMIIREGAEHYEQIGWEDVFNLIADHLNRLSTPHQAVFYTSGRSSNEAAFLYQLFVRQYGTNNLPDCSNMCHESSGVALTETIGLGKGSVTLEDFEKAEVIIIMGQNPGTNHPRMLTSLEKAKHNGASVISVNPLLEPGLLAFSNPQTIAGITGKSTSLSDLYYQIKINGDLAFLKALIKILIAADEKNPGKVLDKEFIADLTQGFEELKAELDNYSLEKLCAECGIPLSEINKLADLLIAKNRIIVCWAMGITQHKNAVNTIREIVNLLLMKGSIGKPGAGVCPVRGHSNVQGDRTMGIFHHPPAKLVKKLKDVFDIDVPEEEGFDVVHAIKAMYSGAAKVFLALGGNLMAAAPDTHFTAQAFRNCDLTVQISTKLNRSHLVHGKIGIILPCLGRTDKDMQKSGQQFLSTENSMGVVQMTRGILQPLSDEMKSEPWIVANIAHTTLGKRSKFDWLSLTDNYDKIRELIAESIDGFEDMNARIRRDGGFWLPNGPREARFNVPGGKAKFTVNQWKPLTLKNDELLLMTIRSHDQFNTTIYGMNDRYRGIYNERRVLFMSHEDMKRSGLKQYDIVDIFSNYDNVERKAEKFILIEYSIPEQCIAAYYPETNPLIPIDSIAEKSNTPASKSVIVKLKKAGRYDVQTKKAEILKH
jgi:molybdopterin-dependent oxidoreductase alpha subunit